MTDEPQDNGEQQVADTLSDQRPVPAPGFRGALGRYLAETDPGYGPRPERLRAMVAGLVGGGLIVVVLGLLQATGSF